METWKIVFDGKYEVSDLGNIRRAVAGISTFIGRPVIPSISAGGYGQVALPIDGKQKRFYVHQLVMLAFKGDRPKGFVINHKDCDRTNNKLFNLEYITQKQNNIHAFQKKGRQRGPRKHVEPLKGLARGDNHWMRKNPEKICRGEQLKCKLTTAQVISIKEKRKKHGASINELCAEFKISRAQVSRICNGTRWSHIV